MPRLRPSLLRLAHASHPLAPLLLRQTRTLPSALQELSWLRKELPASTHHLPALPPPSRREEYQLRRWGSRRRQGRSGSREADVLYRCAVCRSRGYPLQYILQSQPFLGLDVGVSRDVLIPRSETEEWTMRAVVLLREYLARGRGGGAEGVLVVDACAGSGCVGLAIAQEVPRVDVLALELSPGAIGVAERNKKRNGLGDNWTISQCDVLDVRLTAETIRKHASEKHLRPTLLVSNPPYIFPRELTHEGGLEARSVRKWEPALALYGGDTFYEKLIQLADGIGVDGMVFEVGSSAQAVRVKAVLEEGGWKGGLWEDMGGVKRCVVGWRQGGWEDLAKGDEINYSSL